MTEDDISAVLERVRSWPAERQEDLAQIARQIEEQDAADYRLTDEQAEAVRRIREDVRAGKFASDDEMAALRMKLAGEGEAVTSASPLPRSWRRRRRGA